MLVGFGRYDNHRPRGLRVSQGSFMLNDLMDSWACHEGLTRQEVLHAVRVHMFHEDHVQLRFEIQQKHGDTMIRVMPKRGHHSQGNRQREDLPRMQSGAGRAGQSGHGAPSSSTEAYAEIRPIPKKAPLPPPPNFQSKALASSAMAKAPAKPPGRQEPRVEPRVVPPRNSPAPAPPAPVKVEPEPDFSRDEPPSPPDPPPGENWEEYEDGGKSWYYYFGPKGHWCCQGPGLEVLPYEMLTME